MSSPEALLSAIEQAVLANQLPPLSALTSPAPAYDSLLEARDADAFATPWNTAYTTVTALYHQAGVPAAITSRLDTIRQHLYKRVYQATHEPDLAAYVSDDFDLILKHLLTDTHNPWVNALWLAYQAGRIPSGALPDTPGPLADLMG